MDQDAHEEQPSTVTTMGDPEKQGSIYGIKALGEWRENAERKYRMEDYGIGN